MIMWAVKVPSYNTGHDYFFGVNYYRRDAHNELLKCWYPKEKYDTPRGRRNCLKRLRRKNRRVVKVEVKELGK